MPKKQDEWCFLRLRAEQLFEEGEVKAALRLMKNINREQQRRMDKHTSNMNESKTVSTLGC